MMLRSREMLDVLTKQPKLLIAEGGELMIEGSEVWKNTAFQMSGVLKSNIINLTFLYWNLNYGLPDVSSCPNLKEVDIWMDDEPFSHDQISEWIKSFPEQVILEIRIR